MRGLGIIPFRRRKARRAEPTSVVEVTPSFVPSNGMAAITCMATEVLREPEILPQAVREAIDSAQILSRPPQGEGDPRMILFLPGLNPFLHSEEGTRNALVKLFPELSADLLAQGVRRVRSRIVCHVRCLELTDPDRRPPWRDRY